MVGYARNPTNRNLPRFRPQHPVFRRPARPGLRLPLARLFLNGQLLGDHAPSFTPGYFDARPALKTGSNEILIRVGADRDAVGRAHPNGFDFEKERYIPGIFDSVELILSGTPHFISVQAAPDVAHKTVRVQAVLRNAGGAATTPQAGKRDFRRPRGEVRQGCRAVDEWADGGGALVTTAKGTIYFTVGGNATIIGGPERDFEAGVASVLLRAGTRAGEIAVSAIGAGLPSVTTTVTAMAKPERQK